MTKTDVLDVPQIEHIATAHVMVVDTVDEVLEYPPLTLEEDNFALAVIECGGNIAAAYRLAFGEDAVYPLAKGKELLMRAPVALRITAITDKIQDASLISLGAHLHELASIRDLSKVTGQMKVALEAERSRGEVTGLYAKHSNLSGPVQNNQFNFVMASKHDANI